MEKINGKKLKELLMKDGARLVDHDRKIGYADGYFHNCIRRNQINNIGIKYLASNNFDLSLILVSEPNLTSNTRVEVDADIINDFLTKNNMSKSEMSKDIGRGRSHISNILCEDRTISRSDYLAIKSIYGIDIEKKANNITEGINAIESLPTKPKATKLIVKDNRPISELTADELSRLIHKSVYSAIIQANKMIKE